MHFLYYFMGKKSCLNMITVSIDQILSSSLVIQRSDLNKETRTYIQLNNTAGAFLKSKNGRYCSLSIFHYYIFYSLIGSYRPLWARRRVVFHW